MKPLLGPAPCSVCGEYLEWMEDHRWYETSGPAHHCPGPRSKAQPSADPRARAILREVALDHSLPPEDIRGRSRRRDHVLAREDAVYRLWKETGLSLHAIGRMLDGRDHSSVSYILRQHEKART